jgi:hypothetical protein
MSFGLTRASEMPREWNFRRTIRPIGVFTVSTCENTDQITGVNSRSHLLPRAERFLARVPPRQPGPVIPVTSSLDLLECVSAPVGRTSTW